MENEIKRVSIETTHGVQRVLDIGSAMNQEIFNQMRIPAYALGFEPKPDPINADLLSAIREGLSSLHA